ICCCPSSARASPWISGGRCPRGQPRARRDRDHAEVSARELEAERAELSELAIGRRSAQILHAVIVVPRYQLFEARRHLLGVELHRAERLRRSEEARLTHHDQVAKAARILIKRLDLLVDLLRRAGEDVAARHLILEGGIPRYDRVRALHEV